MCISTQSSNDSAQRGRAGVSRSLSIIAGSTVFRARLTFTGSLEFKSAIGFLDVDAVSRWSGGVDTVGAVPPLSIVLLGRGSLAMGGRVSELPIAGTFS